MKKDKYFFINEAINLAIDNIKSQNGGPFGAVIVKDGDIIAKGVNTVTTTNDPTAHAEINAIRNACEKLDSFQLDGCEIYTSCEPCPMCLGAIYWARPEKVYYASSKEDAAKAGFDDSFIYKEIDTPISKRKIKMQALPIEKTAEVFKLWQEAEDKTDY